MQFAGLLAAANALLLRCGVALRRTLQVCGFEVNVSWPVVGVRGSGAWLGVAFRRTGPLFEAVPDFGRRTAADADP